MPTTDELFDDLMNNCKRPEDLGRDNSLFSQLFRTTIQTSQQRWSKERQEKNSGIVANHLQNET